MKTIFLFCVLLALPATTRAAGKDTNSLVQETNQLTSIQREYAEVESGYYKTSANLPDTVEGAEHSETLWKEFDKETVRSFVGRSRLDQP